jgi:hypothetical protein
MPLVREHSPDVEPAALHEDDWMVTILACDSCRQAEDEASLGLPCNLLEAMRR